MEEEEQNYSLEEFLKTRNVEDKTIQRFIDEKIDLTAVKVMTDEELSTYLPAHGDRIALKSFALKTRRKSLIEKLKTSFNSFGDNKEKAPLTKKKKENPQKATRKVEIGWRHYCDKKQSYKHVRGPIGGNRRISVLKIAKAEDITEKAIELFFPDGSCPYGKINEFEFELQDYKCHKISDEIDVNEIYKVTGLSNVRFYLSTKRKTSLKNPSDDDDYATDINTPDKLLDELSSPINSPNISISGPSISTSDQRSEKVYVGSYYEEFMENQPFSMEIIFDSNNLQDPNPSPLFSVSSENTAVEPAELITNTSIEKLVLHRGHIFEELITAVKTHDVNFQKITIELILPNGKPEAAEDLGGVFRDTISEFWISFYEKYTEGTDYKVPFIRHDFGELDWKAVAKVLASGFLKEKYFPIKIAPTFMSQCLNKNFTNDELVSDFLKYVNQSDRELITTALQNFDEVDYDELLVLCSSYKSKWLPSKDNFKTLVESIAQQELIQKTAFVSQCFGQELDKIATIIDIKEVYKKLLPSVKNIISALDVSKDLPENNMKTHGYLLRYIKESDENTRSALLRFCTGSNLVIDKIKIEFIESEGFSRVPIGHTCSNLLQVPNTYENYVEFRSEFNSLFVSNMWVMDIV